MTYDVLDVDLKLLGTMDIVIPFGLNCIELAEEIPLDATIKERFEVFLCVQPTVTLRVGQPVVSERYARSGAPESKAFLIVVSGDVTKVRSFVPLEKR